MKTQSQLFLGFDLSTQGLKALIFDYTNFSIIAHEKLIFEKDLPQYKTDNGVYIGYQGEVTSNSYMFVEAIDTILQKFKSQKINFSQILAVSFSAEQHGSIYWRNGAQQEILSNLDPSKSLCEQLKEANAFSKPYCPIWMDSSTTKYCKILETYVGGPSNLSQITGSAAFERFTGNQFAKIVYEQPGVYQQTEHLTLISCFISELFLGKYTQIDSSDGSGMNMMDIKSQKWYPLILDYVSNNNRQDFLNKLGGQPQMSHQCAGLISKYFVQRYGFSENCQIIIGTGDNPSTLIGLGMFTTGEIGISLGSSDTVVTLINDSQLQSNTKNHIFVSPSNPYNQFMLLMCTKNGALTRQKYKKLLADDSWSIFNKLISKTPPGNNGNCGIFIEFPEIIPNIRKQNFSLCIDSQGQSKLLFDDPGTTLRALLESKIMSLKSNLSVLNMSNIHKIIVTGGGSNNQEILQIIADIFEVNVYVAGEGFVEDSAAFGSCLRACHGYYCNISKKFIEFSELYKDKNIGNYKLVASPRKELKGVYENLMKKYKALEQKLIDD